METRTAPVLVIELRADAARLDALRALAALLLPASRVLPPSALTPAAGVSRAVVSSQYRRKASETAGGKLAKRAARKSPPVSAGRVRESVWTEARNAVVRRDWPRGIAASAILRTVNELSGPKILNIKLLGVHVAGKLKVHRPGRKPQRRTAPSKISSPPAAPAVPPPRQVAAPPPQPKPPRRSPASPLESRDGLPSVAQRQLLEAEADNATAPSTWLDAMTWAHRNKVPLGGTEAADLRATNQARRAAGLPPYRIVERRGPPERLPAPTLGRDFEGAAA